MKWKKITEVVLRVLWALRLMTPPPEREATKPSNMPMPCPSPWPSGARYLLTSKSECAKTADARAAVLIGSSCSKPLRRSQVLSLLRSDCRRSKRVIDLLVLHCTDTRPNQSYTIEQLCADHERRGFGDYPGYHLYVRRDGTLYYTRPVAMMGCHVRGYNARSIGICYEGGHSASPEYRHEDNRTAEQLVVLDEVLRALHEAYPEARIVGHSELNPHKACPCLAQKASVEYAYITA